jgi:hypothetical protein
VDTAGGRRCDRLDVVYGRINGVRGTIGRVVVGFNVTIRKGESMPPIFGKKYRYARIREIHMLTFDNAHNVEFRVGTGDCIGKNVAHSQVNRLLVEIVCEDDETSVEGWSHI